MKKIYLQGVLAGLLAGGLVFSAQAFDLGGKMKDAAKGAAKGASKAVVESEINKDLKKNDCAFKPKTTKLTCNLDEILNTLKVKKSVAEESGFANDVDIHVDVGEGKDPKNANLGSQRLDLVRNELKQKVSWWDWYDQSVAGDKLLVYVKIR